MKAQLSLFPDTIPSPLCMYIHCTRKGRAVLGPPRISEEGGWRSTTRSITCLKCGCFGDQCDTVKLTPSS